MATSTTERRERREARKAGRALLDGDGLGGDGHGKAGAAAPTAAELRGQLDKVRAQQTELSPSAWGDVEKKRRLDKQARELEGQVEGAELRELPHAGGGAALSRFQERSVPVAAIRITGNHREGDDAVETARLAHLIRSSGGLQQRIGLRAIGDGTFELIWGNRRLAATKLNGDLEIPAKVYGQDLTPDDVETLRSIDNLGKKDLTHVERALAVARNIDAVKKTLEPLAKEAARLNYVVLDPTTLQELSASKDPPVAAGACLQIAVDAAGGLFGYVGGRLGRGERWARENSYVADLGGEARRLLAAGRITVGHARELAKLKDKGRTDSIAGTVARDENGLGGMTVADARRMVVEAMCDLSRVPWDLHQAFGKDERKGCHGYACSACPFNSKADPDLFEGVVAQNPERGVCTNPACFEVKEKLAQKMLGDAVVAARKEKKEHKVELTVRGLGTVINKFRALKPESLVRRVKKELEPQEKKASSRSSGSYGRQLTPAEKAEADARQKFEDASQKWQDAQCRKMNAALDAAPARATAFHLITSADFYRELSPYGPDTRLRKKATDTLAKQRTKDLINVLKAPTLEGIAALEQAADDGHRLEIGRWQFERLVPEARAMIAAALDVTLDPPPPDEKTFLDAAKTKLTGKPAAAAPAKGKAKPKKGKKSGRANVVPDDTCVDPMGDDGFGTDEDDGEGDDA